MPLIAQNIDLLDLLSHVRFHLKVLLSLFELLAPFLKTQVCQKLSKMFDDFLRLYEMNL